MNRYPSDEELERFIAQMEKEELYAPAHLKEEILSKSGAAKQKNKGSAAYSVRNTQVVKIQMFTYSLKIATGMAAAIAMLMLIPQSDMQQTGSGWIQKIEAGTQLAQEATSKLNRKLVKLTNYTIMEDRNNENKEKK